MDIEYLLLLQGFRNNINNALTPFMEMISLFAVTYLVLVPTLVYWCLSKRDGLYTLASFTSCVAVNAVVKLTACVYRPWIRDARVLPAGDAITTATGYSFPSGHTMTAGPIYGGISITTWRRLRWISVLSLICLFLTAFSRNYLGVHTPQDVGVGLLLSALTLFCMSRVFRYLHDHPEKENLFLAGGLLFCVASLIYITCKPYPMDYVDGKLLVDPQKMMKDGYGDTAKLVAFCIGRFIEKTWIKYEPQCTRENLAAGLVGAVLAFFLIQMLGAPLRAALGLHWGAFVENLILYLYIVAGWPAVMKAVVKPAKA